MRTKKPKTASQILKRYEDANEYHFHKLDRKWIEEAMAEYSAQNCDLIQELFTRPAQVLKPLEDLYRKENPDPNGRFYVPDTTKFYEWIVSKFKKELENKLEKTIEKDDLLELVKTPIRVEFVDTSIPFRVINIYIINGLVVIINSMITFYPYKDKGYCRHFNFDITEKEFENILLYLKIKK